MYMLDIPNHFIYFGVEHNVYQDKNTHNRLFQNDLQCNATGPGRPDSRIWTWRVQKMDSTK